MPSQDIDIATDRVDRLLERIRSVRALVIGDLMLDVYLAGDASRISPEAPVPVVRVDEEWHALGGAANVAHNAAVLGARCTVIGCTGEDMGGLGLSEELRRRGIDDAGVLVIPDRATSVKTRVMVRNQQVARYDREVDGDLSGPTAEALVGLVRDLAAGADVLILEDYDKGVLSPSVSRAAIQAAAEHGVPSVVDPKSRHFFDYAGATVFKPNRGELEAALREPVLALDPDWLDRTRLRLHCDHLLVTLGGDGMVLLSKEEGHVRFPTSARAVYDVSGAGDTVTAVLAVALAAGASMREAALLANLAAGIEVGKAGVSTVQPEELRASTLTGSRGIIPSPRS